jgi:hypothetical protein
MMHSFIYFILSMISILPFTFAVTLSGASGWWMVAIFAGYFWHDITRDIFDQMKTNRET